MREKKSDIEVLVPKEKTIVIAGQAYVVKPFRVKDLVYFGREIQEAIASIVKKYPKLDLDKLDSQTFLPILLSEGERLLGLFARSIGKEKIWLEEQADVVGFSALFQAVTEVNDFAAIISNFMQGWSQLKAQKLKTSAAA